mmetsp:Transcript_38573/g.86703  ORF Transcript_38573/g.86703 Transcript_38573/m.86703 type:complete len:211 (-) Transcript_38573:19-651(-)
MRAKVAPCASPLYCFFSSANSSRNAATSGAKAAACAFNWSMSLETSSSPNSNRPDVVSATTGCASLSAPATFSSSLVTLEDSSENFEWPSNALSSFSRFCSVPAALEESALASVFQVRTGFTSPKPATSGPPNTAETLSIARLSASRAAAPDVFSASAFRLSSFNSSPDRANSPAWISFVMGVTTPATATTICCNFSTAALAFNSGGSLR